MIGILGAGESGVGAALLAATLNYDVFVSDFGEINPDSKTELKKYNVPFEESGHTFEKLIKADLIVKSPGIPQTAKVVQSLRTAGKEIISEIEFAFRHCKGKVIAITGSNGKTTTTMMIHHILQYAGIDAALCGNVGVSFAKVVATEPAHDWYVVEVSSFQLEDVDMFQPEIAVLLNISPDHLDRYGGSIQRYAETKWRIARRMKTHQLLIGSVAACSDYELMERFPIEAEYKGVNEGEAARVLLNPWPEHLNGIHDIYNAMCAMFAARRTGITGEQVLESLQSFEKPPHRMQLVGEARGVRYINDSKATNTDSVFMAMLSMKTPVVWIAGGQNKGNDYSDLKDLVQKKVHTMICLGIDNEHLIEAFSSKVDGIQETTSMQQAVNLAASAANSGDTVLLSPACASFDLFKNYIDRGQQFIEAVEALSEEMKL